MSIQAFSASPNHTGPSIAAPQVTTVSQGNISEQQSTTHGDNLPDDTTVHLHNENTSTLESDAVEPELQDSENLSDESDSERGVSPEFKLKAMMAVTCINLEISKILIQYPRYDYEAALMQLVNDWSDSERFGQDSFEYGVLALKVRTEFPDFLKIWVQATKADIEKSGLEVISLKQLEQYERDGKVRSDCTQQCLFCFEQYKAKEEVRVMKNCQHAFHRRCIDKWLTKNLNSCPECRAVGIDAIVRKID